ncbi:hypothetical protein K523DRAFT_253919 [Schizophyllum commune Tattone D]|nr:hypothetical protein K523DRAFT_253919 [Schizophyllum commune Tattone D]
MDHLPSDPLPTEIKSCILDELQVVGAIGTLASCSSASRALHHIATPILYKEVWLPSQDAANQFLRTIKKGRLQALPRVRTLHILEHPYRWIGGSNVWNSIIDELSCKGLVTLDIRCWNLLTAFYHQISSAAGEGEPLFSRILRSGLHTLAFESLCYLDMAIFSRSMKVEHLLLPNFCVRDPFSLDASITAKVYSKAEILQITPVLPQDWMRSGLSPLRTLSVPTQIGHVFSTKILSLSNAGNHVFHLGQLERLYLHLSPLCPSTGEEAARYMRGAPTTLRGLALSNAPLCGQLGKEMMSLVTDITFPDLAALHLFLKHDGKPRGLCSSTSWLTDIFLKAPNITHLVVGLSCTSMVDDNQELSASTLLGEGLQVVVSFICQHVPWRLLRSIKIFLWASGSANDTEEVDCGPSLEALREAWPRAGAEIRFLPDISPRVTLDW